MNLERFLEKIYQLLCEGYPSQATDLLTDFLLETYGRPRGLQLSEPYDLSQKQPEEIVEILRETLVAMADEESGKYKQKTVFHDDLDEDDLYLIDEIAQSLDRQCETYDLDEEIHDVEKASSNSSSTSHNLATSPPFPELNDSLTGPQVKFLTKASAKISEDGQETEVPSAEIRFATSSIDEDQVDSILDDDLELLEKEEFDDDSTLCSGEEEADDEISDEDYEEDEFCDERDELNDVAYEGKLSREERAYQIAIEVGLSYGWEKEGIDVLHEIFVENGWGQARIAMERELADGTSEEEIRLAKELKEMWADRADFWMAFFQSRKDSSDYTYPGGRVLSWRMALSLVRLFPNGADISEIEFFLENEYSKWLSRPRRRALHNSFLGYLFQFVKTEENIPGFSPHFNSYCEDVVRVNERRDLMLDLGTPMYAKLSRLGLVPDVWLDYSDHSMGPPDAERMKDFR
jgi:hypothetical protein